MAVRTGNDVLGGVKKTTAITSPRPERIENSDGTPRQSTFTILPDGIILSNELTIHQKLMLCYLLRQAAYKKSNKITVSISVLLEHIGTTEKRTLFKSQKALISKGYMEKDIETTENGKITKYKLDIKKIQRDFNFDFLTIFCK